MRKAWMAVFTLLLGVTFAAAQQQAPPKQEQPPQSAAEAARKAREEKKNAPKAKRVFTNDDVQSIKGTASVVGTVPPPPEAAPGTEAKKEGEMTPAEDEAAWRKRFADARLKLAQAEKELDILQRELNLLSQQYYSDPTKAMQEQYNRKEINDQRAKIDAKQKEVEQLKQAISNLEDELRKAGKPAKWAEG
jgi:chromosome segregation ATPase